MASLFQRTIVNGRESHSAGAVDYHLTFMARRTAVPGSDATGAKGRP